MTAIFNVRHLNIGITKGEISTLVWNGGWRNGCWIRCQTWNWR